MDRPWSGREIRRRSTKKSMLRLKPAPTIPESLKRLRYILTEVVLSSLDEQFFEKREWIDSLGPRLSIMYRDCLGMSFWSEYCGRFCRRYLRSSHCGLRIYSRTSPKNITDPPKQSNAILTQLIYLSALLTFLCLFHTYRNIQYNLSNLYTFQSPYISFIHFHSTLK